MESLFLNGTTSRTKTQLYTTEAPLWKALFFPIFSWPFKKLANQGFTTRTNIRLYMLAACVMLSCSALGQKVTTPKPLPPLSTGANGKLVYSPDSLGNRILDFSYAGYMSQEHPIPDVPVRVVVPVTQGDATLRIQSAIDYVASLLPDKDGVRGAVLLEKGTYVVQGALQIRFSGIILRGSGMGANGTTIRGAGTDRQTLIRVSGTDDRSILPETKITDSYLPVNARVLQVAPGHSFRVGELVLVHRPSTLKWIQVLGTEHFGGGITSLGWKPGQRDIYWDRKIVGVAAGSITVDAPITTALDSNYGGGFVARYNWPGRISQVGIENLRCISDYDSTNPKDEAHRWMGLTMENISDSWVRQVVFEHFAGSAVALFETTNRITVEDCKSLSPVSEIGGQRRSSFYTSGQQALFQRNYAEDGFHDFSVGFCASGPTAFVQCHSQLPHSFSGSVDSWASGILFDVVNVDGNALRFGNRGQDGQGAGWSAANSVFWQCTAAIVDCYKPPTANNWAFGTWAQFSGDGYWGESNNSVQPRSLFYAQLKERLGEAVANRGQLLPLKTEASSSPSVTVAAELNALSFNPALTLFDWIDHAAARNAISVNDAGAKKSGELVLKPTILPKQAAAMHLVNGWIVRGDKLLTGKRTEVPWWMGTTRPFGLKDVKPHITRFVPGRTGNGMTDDLAELANTMIEKNMVALEHNYGLWYERRRDDHERIRRMDGDVWPPFYELPFARSGEGAAWDGLSKYDLTKYNKWYWSRLRQFADLADQKGLILIHQDYFQHNIIEAGAHYADFPWRSANNINNTGFPEPPPYAGDKRIFMAEQFYDITDPVRRAIHIAYIRKCMDNFAENSGVIHFIGAEFTGPLHFVKFWLNTIRDWEKETGKKALIGLSTTKDVQDSILADPALADVVDLVDIRYWHYQQNGTAYAPAGGQNLAPRQHARLLNPKKSSFEQVYRATREYKEKFPLKAVIYSGDSYDSFGWASLMGGGSLPVIPALQENGLLASASTMQPMKNTDTTKRQYFLGNSKGEYLIYNQGSAELPVDLANLKGMARLDMIDPNDGRLLKQEKVRGGGLVKVKIPFPGPVVIWIRR